MLTVDPGLPFSASVSTGVSGQAVAVQVVIPGEQRVMIPRTTAGVTEFPAGSGVYGVELTAPIAAGLYMVIWDWADTDPITPANSSTDQMVVNYQPPQYYAQNELVWPWRTGGDVPGAGVSNGPSPIPTAADVRASSQLVWADYGAGLDQDAGPGGLQEQVDRAESAFYAITGQTLSSISANFAPLVRRVIQGMTEQVVMSSSSDVLDTQSDWDLISSFSAGPYSEQHRSGAEMLQARMLFPIPWISQALWTLCTPDRYAFWQSFYSQRNMPAFEGTDVFWETGQVMGDVYGPPAGNWFGGY